MTIPSSMNNDKKSHEIVSKLEKEIMILKTLKHKNIV